MRGRLGAARGTANVLVEPTATGFHVDVTANGQRRTLEAGTCEEATEAAVLILRLALEGAPSPPPPPAAPPPPPPPAPAPAPEAVPWRAQLTALGSARLARWPFALGGGALALDLSKHPWHAEVLLRTWGPVRSAAGSEGAGITLHPALEGELSACWLPALGPVRVGACALAGLGWWRIAGDGVRTPNESSLALWSLGGGARLQWPLWRGLTLEARGFLVGGPRPEVSLDGAPVLSAQPLGVDLSAGLGWAF